MAFWSWSKTAASNATADATINWQEGQAPSSINDSARAVMARLAEYRDDISGTITTGGTATAFTVTSNQVFDSLAHMNGAMIAFIPHATNTGGSGTQVTLNVDGLGAKPIRFAPGVNIESGVLILGTPYVVAYVNADSAFYLRSGAGNPYGTPLGGMIAYTGNTAPNSAWAIPIGQAISQSTYATLYALYGASKYGADSGGNFLLPDLRGRAVFSPDSGGSGRITVAGGNFDGTVVGGTGGAQNHTLTTGEMPTHNHGVTDGGHTHSYSTPNYDHSVSIAGGFLAPAGNTSATSGSATTGITINNAGSGGAHTILPPAMVLPYILRII